MCQLLESLKLNDGRISNPEFHQNRMHRSMAELFSEAPAPDLAEAIIIPEHCKSGLFKVRVLYRNDIEKVEIEPYVFRKIQSLKVVHHDSIDYHLKYTDRQILQELYAQRCDCDDIIIIKKGLVTDSFAANILLFDGQKWFTPSTPLLKGTQREYLLQRGKIHEKEIREEDIFNYQKVGLINALNDMEEMPVIPIEQVYL